METSNPPSPTSLSVQNVGPFSYILIDEIEDILPAVNEIKSKIKPGYCPSLAVDLEGVTLGRNGSITVVTIATIDTVYLFDALKLGSQLFRKGLLKDILENPSAEKLMFDCRHDADALWHLHGVFLDGVLDLQLMDILIRRKNLPPESFPIHSRKVHMIHKGVERLNGYGACACYHVADLRSEMAKFKEAGKNLFLASKDLWNMRPLTEDMINYCCIDTAPMFKMFDVLSGKILSKFKGPEYMERARDASKLYADNLRKMKTYTGNVYEEHNYLPFDMDVYLEFAEIAPTSGGLTCPNCQRVYHSYYFLTNVHQSCIVCLKIIQNHAFDT